MTFSIRHYWRLWAKFQMVLFSMNQTIGPWSPHLTSHSIEYTSPSLFALFTEFQIFQFTEEVAGKHSTIFEKVDGCLAMLYAFFSLNLLCWFWGFGIATIGTSVRNLHRMEVKRSLFRTGRIWKKQSSASIFGDYSRKRITYCLRTRTPAISSNWFRTDKLQIAKLVNSIFMDPEISSTSPNVTLFQSLSCMAGNFRESFEKKRSHPTGTLFAAKDSLLSELRYASHYTRLSRFLIRQDGVVRKRLCFKSPLFVTANALTHISNVVFHKIPTLDSENVEEDDWMQLIRYQGTLIEQFVCLRLFTVRIWRISAVVSGMDRLGNSVDQNLLFAIRNLPRTGARISSEICFRAWVSISEEGRYLVLSKWALLAEEISRTKHSFAQILRYDLPGSVHVLIR